MAVGFFAEIDRFRRFGLHAKGQFITGDAGLQFALFGMLLSVLPINVIEQIELACVADGRVTPSGRVQIGNGLVPLVQANALIHGWHETGSPSCVVH